MAAILLVGLVLNQHSGPTLTTDPHSSPMVAMAFSNQSFAAYLPGNFASEQNHLPTGALEWDRRNSSGIYLRPDSPQVRTN
jgi:hypothetical protein